MTKFHLLAATALALTAATPGWAQTVGTSPANPAPADANNDPSTLPPAATTDDAPTSQVPFDNSGEVVVTAAKREQTLQDTPISVAVTSAETIERAQVRDLIDLQTLVPSLRVTQLQSSTNTNFIIRGFGNGANNAGIEPSVGVFIDGVYRSRSAAQIGDLPNITRIEVLRGPQSTLFGKNASAGIISIVTEQPQFQFGGGLEVSYGNYDAIVVKGDVTGPITDTIAFSLAGNVNKRDGYARYVNLGIDNNDRDRWGVRGQILFEPSSDFKVRIIGDYDKIDEICCTVANLVDGPTGAIVRALGGQVLSNQPNAYDSFANIPSVTRLENYGGSGQVDWGLTDDISLTSITAYRRVESFTNQDSDFTSADLIGSNAADTRIGTFTQEFRLASSFDGPLNFLLGGFYFNEKVRQDGSISFGTQFRPYGDALIRAASGNALNVALLEQTFGALEGAPTRYVGAFFRTGDGLREAYRLNNESFSIFGTVDFEPIEGLTITGGLNYTKDRKRFSTGVVSTDVFSGLNLDAPQFAPFRNQLLFQGALAQTVGTTLGLGRSATAAEIGAFAGRAPAAFAQISAGAQAFATANQNVVAANPLGGLRAFQFLPPFLNVPNAIEPGRTDDDKLTYTARVAYKLSRHLNVYGTYATGFKASSINLSRDSRPTPADLVRIRGAGLATVNLASGSRFAGPEEATVYEIGVKGSWPGFSFNLALFDQTLKGFQSNVFQGTGFVLGNAEKQSTQGVEIDSTISPTRNLNFTASLTYLDPTYDSFTGAAAFNPATNTVVPTNLTGLRPSGVPDYTVSVGGNYTLPFGDTNAAIFHIDYQLSGSYQVAQGLRYKASPESLNASIAFTVIDGLQLSVWGRNLTEPKFNGTIFPGVAQAGTLSAYPAPPRTYGVSARYEF